MPSPKPRLTEAQKAVLQDHIDREIVKALRTAKIVVRVKRADFRNVLSGKYDDNNTVATLEMQEPHNRVQVHPAKKDPNQQSVHVWPGGATIRFKVVSDTKADEFHPIGIAFVRTSGAVPANRNGDRIGRLNFDQTQIRPVRQFLYVTDSFKDAENDDRFKFSIIIQRQSDGAIGIIDPCIEHEH